MLKPIVHLCGIRAIEGVWWIAGAVAASIVACSDKQPSPGSGRDVSVAAQAPAKAAGAELAPSGGAAGAGPVSGGADGGAGDPTGPLAPPADPPPMRTRLEARQLEADGTPPLVLGIWDTRQEVHCDFVTAEDGKLRCLPEEGHATRWDGTFADAECRTPIWQFNVEQAEASVARPHRVPLARSSCEPIRYQVLRPLPAGSQVFSIQASGCRPTAPVGEVLLAVEAPDQWEMGIERDGARVSDRLRLVETVTADGARFVERIVDDHWGMPCKLQPGKIAGSLECLPPVADDYDREFSDDACVSPLFRSGPCETPAFIEDFGGRSALGPRYVGPTYRSAHSCEVRGIASAVSTAEHYYSKGDPLGGDAVALTHEATAGTGRLRLRGLLRDVGKVAPLPFGLFSFASSQYFDTVANEDCRPVWMPDRQVRCVPHSVHIATRDFFSDPACQRFAFWCSQGAACATQTVLRTRQVNDPRTPGGYEATAAYASSTGIDKGNIYSGTATTCHVECPSSTNWREVTGDELPLATFPALRERHPPPRN